MATYTPQEMIALSVIFMMIPLITVVLRAWAVRIRSARFTADDYVILAALVLAHLSIGISDGIPRLTSSTTVLQYRPLHRNYLRYVPLPIDTRRWAILSYFLRRRLRRLWSPSEARPKWSTSHERDDQNILYSGLSRITISFFANGFRKCDWTIQVFSALTVGLSKVSIILLYRKIFAVRVFRIPSLIALAITISWTISFVIATICQCHPVSLYWTELELMWGNRCVQIIPFYEAQAITDILIDFSILIMPIPMIWNLQMPFKQKLAVASMFLLGLMFVIMPHRRKNVSLTQRYWTQCKCLQHSPNCSLLSSRQRACNGFQ